jgi:YHS domain-containing protein
MNHSTTATATVTDPVCGMTIDPAKAVGSSSHNGQAYHFCSRGCETKFDVAPAEYAGTTYMAAESASCCSTAETASCCAPAATCC